MKSSPSINELGGLIAKFFRRYHVMLYVLTVVIGVSAAVFLLNSLISQSNSTETTGTATNQAFDQATIKRIESFNTVNKNSDTFSLPPGRVNPFVE